MSTLMLKLVDPHAHDVLMRDFTTPDGRLEKIHLRNSGSLLVATALLPNIHELINFVWNGDEWIMVEDI